METNDVVDFHVGDINTAPDTPGNSRDVIDMSDLVDKNNNDGNNNGGDGGGNDNGNSGVPTIPLISPPVSPPTLRDSTEATSDDDDDDEGGMGGMNNQITMSNETDDAVVDDMLNQALAVAGVKVLPSKSLSSKDDRNDDVEVYEDQTASLEEILNHKTMYYDKIDFSFIKKSYDIISKYITLPYVIHLVGTNGKGSTGRFLAHYLVKKSFKTSQLLNQQGFLGGVFKVCLLKIKSKLFVLRPNAHH